ncbi:MAG: TIGR04348 family glycosyltransferase [Alphaproteobacteria bacterium]|nr:TIGR04348 family glycosyltransferase [Alphaproteobacteria bacterium]
MRISLITPAAPSSRTGNRTTAARWARILRGLGHRVQVRTDYGGEPADLMVALHAWRSAAAIQLYRERRPDRPLVVGLAGTDVYRFQASDPEPTLRSMQLADALVGLHDLVGDAIPARFRAKLTIIHQSAPPLPRPPAPSTRAFHVGVIANLRGEKDPLRTALAVGDLPPASRIKVSHVGAALDPAWAARAEALMAQNPRYRWRGEVSGAAVRRLLGRLHLLVLSSVMEGGANVISEAVAAGVPVIASHIAGSIGLLGGDYPGTYPVEDTGALRALLLRAESDAAFLGQLRQACAQRAPLFTVARERAAWAALLDTLRPGL